MALAIPFLITMPSEKVLEQHTTLHLSVSANLVQSDESPAALIDGGIPQVKGGPLLAQRKLMLGRTMRSQSLAATRTLLVEEMRMLDLCAKFKRREYTKHRNWAVHYLCKKEVHN